MVFEQFAKCYCGGKKSPAKPKVRKTDKLAGCLSKYAKNVDLPFKEIREMAWDAELRDKYDTRRH